MRLRRSLVVVAALVVPALACQLLVGIDDHDFTVPSVEAAAFDAKQPPTQCVLGAAPPGPPPPSSGGEKREYRFAMRSADVRGKSADGVVVGFDLDGVCTCDARDQVPHGPDGGVAGGSVSCAPPASPVVKGGCDDDGGIDDALSHALEQIDGLATAFPGMKSVIESLNGSIGAEIGCGRHTLLFKLVDYNGLANDENVSVVAYQGSGIRVSHEGGIEVDAGVACTPDEAGRPFGAKFDGQDEWATQDLGKALKGYVKDFRIVLDGRTGVLGGPTSLAFLFGTEVIDVGTPIIVGRLIPVDADGNPLSVDSSGTIIRQDGGAPPSFRIAEGILTGRASAKAILVALGSSRFGSGKPPRAVCTQPDVYALLKDVICKSLDTSEDSQSDFLGTPCDALSIAIQFEAEPAKVGAVIPEGPLNDVNCADSSVTCP
jgi:hypothetical protein